MNTFNNNKKKLLEQRAGGTGVDYWSCIIINFFAYTFVPIFQKDIVNFFVTDFFLLLSACISDVFGEQKLGSSWGLLFGFRSGSGINISGTSPSGFQGFLDI